MHGLVAQWQDLTMLNMDTATKQKGNQKGNRRRERRMIELILTVAIVLNVMFLGFVCGQLSNIYREIGCVHNAEIKAHTAGWCDCLKCMDALKERKEE